MVFGCCLFTLIALSSRLNCVAFTLEPHRLYAVKPTKFVRNGKQNMVATGTERRQEANTNCFSALDWPVFKC